MRQLLFPGNAQFWFETLRMFGAIAYGGADFGEVLTTSDRIREGDYESWYAEWSATADRVAAEGERSLKGGHRVSARDAFLRASNYYRSAEFFLHSSTPDLRHEHTYARSVECFRAAAQLFDPVVQPVEIPYEGTTLSGYFYRADHSGTPRPTLIMHSGFDGSAEEMHFSGPVAAVERGYNALVFDGPGMSAAIHTKGLPFRADWEHVVGPVVDFAQSLPEVDNDRIALLGVSLGGLLAPRAAAFEHRLGAVVAIDGVYDARVAFLAGMTDEESVRRLRAESDPELDQRLAAAMATSETMRWALNHGMYVTGTKSPRAFMASMLDYHLGDGVAERIQCPTLVCKAEDDLFFTGQPEALYDHLTSPKTLLEFTAEEGADAHCHVGAQRLAMARVCDWLDDKLAVAAG